MMWAEEYEEERSVFEIESLDELMILIIDKDSFTAFQRAIMGLLIAKRADKKDFIAVQKIFLNARLRVNDEVQSEDEGWNLTESPFLEGDGSLLESVLKKYGINLWETLLATSKEIAKTTNERWFVSRCNGYYLVGITYIDRLIEDEDDLIDSTGGDDGI